MSSKRPKMFALAKRIAEVRRIIDQQQALLKKIRMSGQPTTEAEAMLRTYTSSLTHLLGHELRMKEDVEAKKGETKKKPADMIQLNGATLARRGPSM